MNAAKSRRSKAMHADKSKACKNWFNLALINRISELAKLFSALQIAENNF